MLPNFLCIGAQKSGTTSLWHMLDAHPDVCMARPRETRFFSDQERFALGVRQYATEHFGRWRGEAAIGEKCPEYLCEPRAARRILDTLGPQVRLVISLRSPAQRAYSHYRHNRAMLRECRSFEAAFGAELDARQRGDEVPAAFAYLGRGRYASQLEHYLRLFGPDRLLLVSFETEVETNQSALAARLYDFLGVAPFEPQGLPFRSGRPALDEVSVSLDTSSADSTRHFVEIRRPAVSRRRIPRWLSGVLGGDHSVRRIYEPSDSLREFARLFVETAHCEHHLSRRVELAMNRRYFGDDIEQLRSLVSFRGDHWLVDHDTAVSPC